MRAYHIALFIFLLNFSMTSIGQITDSDGNAIFSGLGTYEPIKVSDYDREFINETARDLRGFEETGDSNTFDAVKFIYQGFSNFVNLFIMSTVGFPLMLMQEPINAHSSICYTLLAGMVIVYTAGMIQLFTGREVEN